MFFPMQVSAVRSQLYIPAKTWQTVKEINDKILAHLPVGRHFIES